MVVRLDRADFKTANLYPAYATPLPELSNEETRTNEEHPYEVVYLDDLEKRKKAFGICSECNEPGTGKGWCKPCEAKKFREEFKNWTSGNKIIDELIQESQLNAVHDTKALKWIPFENFKDVTFIAKGGFGKIYRAEWPYLSDTVALKFMSSSVSVNFINEIKSHLQVDVFYHVVQCYGISQDPVSKEYIMVLQYFCGGNLRDYVAANGKNETCREKISTLYSIISGLKCIHDTGKVHKDFHSGNILFDDSVITIARISDLGLCQPTDQPGEGKIYGVLPYVAPEVLRGKQYTQAADIYSFGIVMNEYLSEEPPFGDIPHDYALANNIFGGARPKIAKHIPKCFVDVIKKCWNGEAKDRPTIKELHQIFEPYNGKSRGHPLEKNDKNKEIEIHHLVKEWDEKYKEYKSKNKSSNNNGINLKFIQTHPQAVFTSRLLDFDVPKFTSDLEFTLDLDQETNDE